MEQAQHFDSECRFTHDSPYLIRYPERPIKTKVALLRSPRLSVLVKYFIILTGLKRSVCVAVASLLTCLHQLRSENTRLEEHIRKLQQRRDHLLAVNARLAIPLTSQTAALPAGPQAVAAGATPAAGAANPVGPPSSQIAAQGKTELPHRGTC